jgi:hypothetical protein
MRHDEGHVRDLARSYTDAWCTHDPARVAAHYVPGGTIADIVEYHWTFTGTNTGAGGTGKPVRISGFEEWTLADDVDVAGLRSS